MTVIDRTDATDEEFDATLARFDAAPAAPESFRERAAEALFAARGYNPAYWTGGGSLHTAGLRRDCRDQIDRVFDEISVGMTSTAEEALRKVEELTHRFAGASHDHGVGYGHAGCAACWVADLEVALAPWTDR